MPVKTLLKGPDGLVADIVNEDENNALVVATRDLKTYEQAPKFMADSAGSVDMNIDASAGGTPVPIHDGTDHTYWTASAVAGTWVFNSTAQAHTGTKSIDGTATGKDSIALFDKGSNLDLSGYVSITGWIYLTNWPVAGTKHIQIYGWDTNTGTMVGTSVNIDNYVSTSVIGSWQKFTMSLTDMGLSAQTIDSIRIQIAATATSPDFYLDDIQIEETGAPVEYTIKPTANTWLHVYKWNVFIVDEYDGTLDTGSANITPTMPKIPYLGFLGVSTLPSGINFRKYVNDELVQSVTFRDVADFLSFPSGRIMDSGDDGTNVWIKIELELAVPSVSKAENNDYLSIVISDDLSGLKVLRIGTVSSSENRDL